MVLNIDITSLARCYIVSWNASVFVNKIFWILFVTSKIFSAAGTSGVGNGSS